MKKFLKIVGGLIALLLVLVGGYVAYAFIQYHRLPDNLAGEIKNNQSKKVELAQKYSIATYNIGYGSYPPDYTFFMDGGKEVRARSKDSVEKAIKEDAALLQSVSPDFVNIQEIDWEGDRRQKVNEPKLLLSNLSNYSSVLTQNYDSAYLFYPISNPIGKAKSGIMSLSKFEIAKSTRYSLPIETNFNKFFDLDRAFSVTEMPIEGSDKKFVQVNVHLSAYTKDQSVQKAQMEKLFKKMQTYVDAGDYVICGGDFNHDLVGRPKNELTWMKSFPTDNLNKGMRVIAPNPETSAPSVRSNGVAIDDPKEIFGWVDGFLVSDNIKDLSVKTVSNNFKSSDHQLVQMEFELNK